MDTIEITPATLAQVHRTRNGHQIAIDDDVQGVARDLLAIDPSLRLHYDPHGEYYVVKQLVTERDGTVTEKLVTTALELDQRIVHRVRQIAHPSYDYAAELDRVDAAADRERDRRQAELVGPMAERLAHALRKDLGATNRAFMPGKDR